MESGNIQREGGGGFDCCHLLVAFSATLLYTNIEAKTAFKASLIGDNTKKMLTLTRLSGGAYCPFFSSEERVRALICSRALFPNFKPYEGAKSSIQGIYEILSYMMMMMMMMMMMYDRIS